jgi:hypothetical protein
MPKAIGIRIGIKYLNRRRKKDNYIQEIIFNSNTVLFEDKKGNMQPVLNQVPAFIADGITDKLTFANLSGITIVSSYGTSTLSISGNDINFTAGTCYGLLLSNGKLFRLTEFSGNTVYSDDGLWSATITGGGSWWTRIDNPNRAYNQLGCKIVECTGGVFAYVPLNIPDATIEADFSDYVSITPILQDGKTFINDDSELDLHPTVSDLIVIEPNITLSDYLNQIETDSGIDLNAYKSGEELPNEYIHRIKTI